MISKELLSEVLGLSTICTKIVVEDNTLIFHWKGDSKLWFEYRSRINIYELAHKCKEWVYKKHCKMIFQTAYFPKPKYAIKDLEISLQEWIRKITLSDMFEADSEPEAIFKATQWILDNKEQK